MRFLHVLADEADTDDDGSRSPASEADSEGHGGGNCSPELVSGGRPPTTTTTTTTMTQMTRGARTPILFAPHQNRGSREDLTVDLGAAPRVRPLAYAAWSSSESLPGQPRNSPPAASAAAASTTTAATRTVAAARTPSPPAFLAAANDVDAWEPLTIVGPVRARLAQLRHTIDVATARLMTAGQIDNEEVGLLSSYCAVVGVDERAVRSGGAGQHGGGISTEVEDALAQAAQNELAVVYVAENLVIDLGFTPAAARGTQEWKRAAGNYLQVMRIGQYLKAAMYMQRARAEGVFMGETLTLEPSVRPAVVTKAGDAFRWLYELALSHASRCGYRQCRGKVYAPVLLSTGESTTAYEEIMSIDRFVMQLLAHEGDVDDRIRLALSKATMRVDVIKALSHPELNEATFRRTEPNRQRFATRNGLLDIGRQTFSPYPVPTTERQRCGDAYRYLDVPTDFVPPPVWAATQGRCDTLAAAERTIGALLADLEQDALAELDRVWAAAAAGGAATTRAQLHECFATYCGLLQLDTACDMHHDLRIAGGHWEPGAAAVTGAACSDKPAFERAMAALNTRNKRRMGAAGAGLSCWLSDKLHALWTAVCRAATTAAAAAAAPNLGGVTLQALPEVCAQLQEVFMRVGKPVVFCRLLEADRHEWDAWWRQHGGSSSSTSGVRRATASRQAATEATDRETLLQIQLRAYDLALCKYEPPLYRRHDILELYAQMPAVLKIFRDQDLPEEVICWALAVGFGRLYFRKLRSGDTAHMAVGQAYEVPAGGRRDGEDWQIVMFFHGPGGTGKSLGIRIALYPFEPHHVMVLESESEQLFALEKLPGSACWAIVEMKRKFTLPEGAYNSLVANEMMSKREKYKGATNMAPNMHGVVAGNEVPNYTDASRSFGRRHAFVEMVNCIPLHDQNQQLFRIVVTTRQLTAFLQVTSRLYLALSSRHDNFWRACPEYFRVQQMTRQADSNPVVSFLQTGDNVVQALGPLASLYYVPMAVFKAALTAFCRSQRNMNKVPNWGEESLFQPLVRMGFTVTTNRTFREYHGRQIQTTWVCGLDFDNSPIDNDGGVSTGSRPGYWAEPAPPTVTARPTDATVGGGGGCGGGGGGGQHLWALDKRTSGGKNVDGYVAFSVDKSTNMRVLALKGWLSSGQPLREFCHRMQIPLPTQATAAAPEPTSAAAAAADTAGRA